MSSVNLNIKLPLSIKIDVIEAHTVLEHIYSGLSVSKCIYQADAEPTKVSGKLALLRIRSSSCAALRCLVVSQRADTKFSTSRECMSS